jgi:hypothetical protein
MGYQNATGLSTGSENTAVGSSAGYALTSGEQNAAFGRRSGEAVTTGTDNTTVGYMAGFNITEGGGNICIGSGTSVAGATSDFQIAIGFEIDAGANEVAIGKAGAKLYNNFTSGSSWSQSSDERLKTDIESDNLGLDFINALRTVKYKWKDTTTLPDELYDHKTKETAKDVNQIHSGFIAQEVKQALDKVSANAEHYKVWDVQRDGVQAISKECFVMPLVKAVQELSAQITTLQQEINTLKGE